MKVSARAAWIAAGVFGLVTGVFAQSTGQAVVTVLPKVDGQIPSSVTQGDLAVKVNGKSAKVTTWAPYAAPNNQVELVILIDGASRTSLGRQMSDIEDFVKGLPPNVQAAIAYMERGAAQFAGPLTVDRKQILANLHLTGGEPGVSASPYFCLSDLAKKWPGRNPNARREVVMVTDGVDSYEPRFDPNDPYVQAAIADAARAKLVVYAIYWKNQGIADQTEGADNAGQNLLAQVTEATGGKNFWIGMGNPVSFAPYFDEIERRLKNQYELGFNAPAVGKPQVENLKLELHAPSTQVNAPKDVYVVPGNSMRQ